MSIGSARDLANLYDRQLCYNIVANRAVTMYKIADYINYPQQLTILYADTYVCILNVIQNIPVCNDWVIMYHCHF